MAWTEDECKRLFEAYWSQGGAMCPTCQRTPVRFNYNAFFGGYFLTASCPRGCGSFQMSNAHDPRAATMRAWTDAEVESIIDEHFANGRPTCPVDGASIRANENPYFGGTIVSVMCPRCGQHKQQNFPRA